MDAKAKENYLKAGEILKKVKENARKSIKPGEKLLDIAERIEKEIVSLHGAPAFPVNLSLNNIAAHYTPSIDDKTVFEAKDVLIVDIGVHVDGYIADSAFTLNPDEKQAKLIKAPEMALQEAINKIEVGVSLGEIGAIIEETIKGYGFNPINNLTGHGLLPYMAHVGPTIPNTGKRDDRKIEEDMAIAIEPFATDGEGWVKESQQSEIFELEEPRQVRNLTARKIMEDAAEKYKTLPFAERWFKDVSDFQRKLALRDLLRHKCIKAFPVLKEADDKLVSQAEQTIIFDGKEKIITT
jgi:methionyl aminopeptidase